MTQIDDGRLNDVLAAESQELPGQASRALGCFADLTHELARFVVFSEVSEQQVTIASNHRQQIVEIVRDLPPARRPIASIFWA